MGRIKIKDNTVDYHERNHISTLSWSELFCLSYTVWLSKKIALIVFLEQESIETDIMTLNKNSKSNKSLL